MSPQWLPEMILLMAGLLAGGIALQLLFSGERRRGTVMSIGSVTLFLLASLLTRAELSRFERPAPAPSPVPLLTPDAQPASDPIPDDSPPGTLLRLGCSILRVAPSKHYVLSADGKRFLALDVETGGLAVSCRLANSQGWPCGRIRRNRFEYFPGSRVHIGLPDPHTLLVGELGREEVLNVRYWSPREIHITGRFLHPALSEPVVISTREGIHWEGGGVSPSLIIDLRHYGPGVIDLERSGLIEVQPGPHFVFSRDALLALEMCAFRW